MKHFLLLAIILGLTSCNKSVSPSEKYLEEAAQHCDCSIKRLGWLQEVTTSGKYQRPDVTMPAPIHQISLSGYGGSKVFILDSPANSCSTCPWVILDCKGKMFLSPSSATPVRDKVIWSK